MLEAFCGVLQYDLILDIQAELFHVILIVSIDRNT